MWKTMNLPQKLCFQSQWDFNLQTEENLNLENWSYYYLTWSFACSLTEKLSGGGAGQFKWNGLKACILSQPDAWFIFLNMWNHDSSLHRHTEDLKQRVNRCINAVSIRTVSVVTMFWKGCLKKNFFCKEYNSLIKFENLKI